MGGRCLGVALRLSAGDLVGRGSRGVLILSDTLPETMLLALPGRPLRELVDHPLVAKRRYRVRAARADRDGGTRIMFDARPLPWRVPWARAETAGSPRDGV